MQQGSMSAAWARAVPDASRLTRIEHGEVYRLAPLRLIPLAFNQQPDIKSSFQRFKSEEARYDFFVVSRDSLTPGLRVGVVTADILFSQRRRSLSE